MHLLAGVVPLSQRRSLLRSDILIRLLLKLVSIVAFLTVTPGNVDEFQRSSFFLFSRLRVPFSVACFSFSLARLAVLRGKKVTRDRRQRGSSIDCNLIFSKRPLCPFFFLSLSFLAFTRFQTVFCAPSFKILRFVLRFI